MAAIVVIPVVALTLLCLSNTIRQGTDNANESVASSPYVID